MGEVVEIVSKARVTPLPQVERGRKRFEIATSGFDENLQGIFSDPYGGTSSVGLRIPALPTSNPSGGPGNRYLFNLCSFSLGEGAKGRILGYRQLVTLGYSQPTDGGAPYNVEFEVTSPFWRFPDGNISWHLQRLGPLDAPTGVQTQGPNDVRNFKYKWCDTPALLYQSATLVSPQYVTLTAYTPPNGGRPWGRPLRNGQQGTFLDLRARWRSSQAWSSLDIPFEGPDVIAFQASVRQTNFDTRPSLAPPGTFFPGGAAPEDQFVLNFPDAIYWRIAGTLIVELE